MTLLVKNDPAQERLLPKHKYTVEEFEQLFAEAEHGDRLLELIHGEIVHEGDMLSGESVLPGFILAVDDIFADPFTD